MRLPAVSGVRGLAMRTWASRGDPLAGRVLAVAGVVVLAVQAERGPAGLVAADDLLLLVQGGAVPELDEHPDDADCLVAAAHRPGGLAVVGPDPDQLVHQPPVADVEVGRAVLEAEQVAVVAVQHQVQHQVVPGPAHQLAQGVEQHVGLVGRQGQEQVPWLWAGSRRSSARNGIRTSSLGRRPAGGGRGTAPGGPGGVGVEGPVGVVVGARLLSTAANPPVMSDTGAASLAWRAG